MSVSVRKLSGSSPPTAGSAKRPWSIVECSTGDEVDTFYGTPAAAGSYAAEWTEEAGCRHEARRAGRIYAVAAVAVAEAATPLKVQDDGADGMPEELPAGYWDRLDRKLESVRRELRRPGRLVWE